MGNPNVAVIDIAKALGLRKQTLFKWIARNNLKTVRVRSPNNGGQHIATVPEEVELEIKAHFRAREKIIASPQHSVFYLVQLEPNHDPLRIKMGITSDIEQRMRHLRCSAPYLQVLNTWPCSPRWELAAMEAGAKQSTRIGKETFTANDLTSVQSNLQAFFTIMPDGY